MVPNNLPHQLTSFVGRERELEQLRAALAETPLLMLSGAGGAGKTRLALELAADRLAEFPDGVWWVDLAALGEPGLVGEALAGCLGVRPLPTMTALEACCAHLAKRRALVVFDNCEHVLAACADGVSTILRSCRDVTVLATSRAPLGLAGETDWRVPPMSLPEARSDPDAIDVLAGSDAVRLLVDRARKVRPDFGVTGDNAPAVARVCCGLDGLPLALEFAAARIRVLSVEQIAAGLVDRFGLLSRGGRSALERHRTLRASMDWSHELLSEPERVVFRRLSVFADAFSLEACERVCAGGDVEPAAILDLLASLVDKSLVDAEDRGPTMRYRLLETVRQYGLERLVEAGELKETRERHLDTFLSLAERLAPTLEGPGQRECLDVLDADAANLMAALECAVAVDEERALRMCVALTLWWRLRGLFTAGDQGFSRALDAGDARPSSLRARALWGRTHLVLWSGRYETALLTAQMALELAETVGDTLALGRALAEIGVIQVQPDPVGCVPVLERARELARASGDDWCLLHAELYLGFSFVIREDHTEAERRFAAILPRAQTRQINDVVALAWFSLGTGRVMSGDLPGALTFGERAFAASGEVGDPVSEGLTNALIGLVELAQGRPDAAATRLGVSRERMFAAGAGLPLAYTNAFLGAAQAALGDLAGARRTLEAVIADGADSGRALAFAILWLGDVLRVAGDHEHAERLANQAREIGERLQNPLIRSWSLEGRGRCEVARGEYGTADALLHEALAMRLEHGLGLWVPPTLDALAELAAGLGSHAEAARILGAAQRARADLGLARWAPDQPRVVELERRLRDHLGDTEYDAVQAEGASLTLEQAAAWLTRARGERKRPAHGWESLTPTEQRVAELVAEGLTNPRIGERMFISRGTVKVHLSHIFAKLGISTRAELAAQTTRRETAAASAPR